MGCLDYFNHSHARLSQITQPEILPKNTWPALQEHFLPAAVHAVGFGHRDVSLVKCCSRNPTESAGQAFQGHVSSPPGGSLPKLRSLSFAHETLIVLGLYPAPLDIWSSRAPLIRKSQLPYWVHSTASNVQH